VASSPRPGDGLPVAAARRREHAEGEPQLPGPGARHRRVDGRQARPPPLDAVVVAGLAFVLLMVVMRGLLESAIADRTELDEVI
jgi:hypothetical protein